MQKTITRIALVAVAALGMLVQVSAPAQASPSGIGWSAAWNYTSPTDLDVNVFTPGAVLAASGTDYSGTRTFEAFLTDTNVNDGKCAFVNWQGGGYDTQIEWCSGTYQFDPPATNAAIEVTVCREVPSTGVKSNCNPLTVPSSTTYPFIRATGNGFHWKYYTDVNTNPDRIEDWEAFLVIGSLNFNYSGVDNFGGATKRWLLPFLTLLNGSTNCASAQIYAGDVPSSTSICGSQIVALPTTTVSGTAIGQACVWSPRTIVPIKNCLTVDVPLPN